MAISGMVVGRKKPPARPATSTSLPVSCTVQIDVMRWLLQLNDQAMRNVVLPLRR